MKNLTKLCEKTGTVVITCDQSKNLLIINAGGLNFEARLNTEREINETIEICCDHILSKLEREDIIDAMFKFFGNA